MGSVPGKATVIQSPVLLSVRELYPTRTLFLLQHFFGLSSVLWDFSLTFGLSNECKKNNWKLSCIKQKQKRTFALTLFLPQSICTILSFSVSSTLIFNCAVAVFFNCYNFELVTINDHKNNADSFLLYVNVS